MYTNRLAVILVNDWDRSSDGRDRGRWDHGTGLGNGGIGVWCRGGGRSGGRVRGARRTESNDLSGSVLSNDHDNCLGVSGREIWMNRSIDDENVVGSKDFSVSVDDG